MPQLVRDAQGKIVHSKLSSEEAAAMGRKRWSKPIAREAEDILEWLGFDDKGKPADPVSRRLAEEVARGGAGTSSNVRELLRHTGYDVSGNGESAPVEPPQPGEICPTCGTVYTPLRKLNQAKIVVNILERFLVKKGKKSIPDGAKIAYPNVVNAQGKVIGTPDEYLLSDSDVNEYVDDIFQDREMPGTNAR